MIKKLLLFFVAAVMAVSCLGGGGYTESRTVIATFEFAGDYNEIFGSDSLYVDTDHRIGVGWDYLVFYQKVNESTSDFEGGMILSHLAYPKSGILDGLANNKYRANAKEAKNANTYLVFEETGSMPASDIAFNFQQSANATGTCIMKSCSVNNTVATAEAVNQKFAAGDKMLLRATGYLDGKKTDSAEITLAERLSDRDSIMYNWTSFDLSRLGAIDKIDFELVIPQGKNIPATVCIDNVIASISAQYK
jgi:hypothetical protein